MIDGDEVLSELKKTDQKDIERLSKRKNILKDI